MRVLNSEFVVFATVSLVTSACVSEITYGDILWMHLNQSFFYGAIIGAVTALIFVFFKGAKIK